MVIDDKNRIFIKSIAKKFFTSEEDKAAERKVVFFEDHISIFDQISYIDYIEEFAKEIGDRKLAYRVVSTATIEYAPDSMGRILIPAGFMKHSWKGDELKVFCMDMPEGKIIEIFPSKEYEKMIEPYISSENGGLKGTSYEERRRKD